MRSRTGTVSSTPMRSPKPIGCCTGSRAAPGPTSWTCGRGSSPGERRARRPSKLIGGPAALVLLLALAVTARAQATLEDGLAAYDRRDYATAFRILEAWAERRQALAQYKLGILYENGKGVKRDYGRALRWYRAAAEQGSAAAQHQLGFMSFFGWGVRQDYHEAARWYRRAAGQDVVTAQLQLGSMYSLGLGVRRDDGEAARWYRRAAELGDPKAQSALAFLYRAGRGVPRDDVEAHKWYSLAAAGLPPGKDRQRAMRRLRRTESGMTGSQISAAQRLARRWQRK